MKMTDKTMPFVPCTGCGDGDCPMPEGCPIEIDTVAVSEADCLHCSEYGNDCPGHKICPK